MRDVSGLRRQVNIVLGGTPGPVSGASTLIGIRVPLACDPFYCYTYLDAFQVYGQMDRKVKTLPSLVLPTSRKFRPGR